MIRLFDTLVGWMLRLFDKLVGWMLRLFYRVSISNVVVWYHKWWKLRLFDRVIRAAQSYNSSWMIIQTRSLINTPLSSRSSALTALPSLSSCSHECLNGLYVVLACGGMWADYVVYAGLDARWLCGVCCSCAAWWACAVLAPQDVHIYALLVQQDVQWW
jgi:hypothetical protein